MKIRYIHKTKDPNIKIGDEAEVKDRVGRELIAGGYAIEIIEHALKTETIKVKYKREVTNPARQAGKPGDVKDLDIALARHLIAEGYVEEYREEIYGGLQSGINAAKSQETDQPVEKDVNTRKTPRKARQRENAEK